MNKPKFEKVGILGYGEIGKAIAKFYKKPYVKDLEANNFPKKLDLLHVCIPFMDKFVNIVLENIVTYEPEVVIIHSTVPVGVTRQISNKHLFTVHSPCRGVHPNLYEGIKTFVKPIGANFVGTGRIVSEHFADIGIKSEIFYKSETTELMKLLDTTYYGLAIAYHAYAQHLCELTKTDFDSVMTWANETYNAGYTKLKKKNVVRPVLTPPNGPIGGHCITPNANILKFQFGNDSLLETILRHAKERTQNTSDTQ